MYSGRINRFNSPLLLEELYDHYGYGDFGRRGERLRKAAKKVGKAVKKAGKAVKEKTQDVVEDVQEFREERKDVRHERREKVQEWVGEKAEGVREWKEETVENVQEWHQQNVQRRQDRRNSKIPEAEMDRYIAAGGMHPILAKEAEAAKKRGNAAAGTLIAYSASAATLAIAAGTGPAAASAGAIAAATGAATSTGAAAIGTVSATLTAAGMSSMTVPVVGWIAGGVLLAAAGITYGVSRRRKNVLSEDPRLIKKKIKKYNKDTKVEQIKLMKENTREVQGLLKADLTKKSNQKKLAKNQIQGEALFFLLNRQTWDQWENEEQIDEFKAEAIPQFETIKATVPPPTIAQVQEAKTYLANYEEGVYTPELLTAPGPLTVWRDPWVIGGISFGAIAFIGLTYWALSD